MVFARNKAYLKQVMVAFLRRLNAPMAVIAESKFLSLNSSALPCP